VKTVKKWKYLRGHFLKETKKAAGQENAKNFFMTALQHNAILFLKDLLDSKKSESTLRDS
jgi:hypothetical protein